MEFNQETDRRIRKAIQEKKIESFNSQEIEYMVNKARICKRKIIIKKMMLIVTFLLIATSGIVLKLNQNNDNSIVNKAEIKEVDNKVTKIIEIIDETTAAEVELSPSILLEKSDLVVIAKIKKIKATNFDKIYRDGQLVYGYSFVRTIGNLDVVKCIKGEMQEQDEIEFRCKGGKLLLSLLINSPNSQYLIDNLNNEYLEENLFENPQNVYISIKYKDIPMLEEGKLYLLYFSKKAWGDFWIVNNAYAIREYDYLTNSVYNNKSLNWESIDFVIGGGEK